jgi:RHS repeat-associated protein
MMCAALFAARGGFLDNAVSEKRAAPPLAASALFPDGGSQALAVAPRLSAEQCAAGFALMRVAAHASPELSMPSNAIIHSPWMRYGVAEDTFWLPATNWAFVLGTNVVDGVYVSSDGRLLFDWPMGFTRAVGLSAGTPASVLAPLHAALGIVPPDGKFWHAPTASNSVLLTWQSVYAGRDTRSPVTFQVELFRNGDFAYRYAFTNALALTNFVTAAQHNGGGETYALNDTSRLASGLELYWRSFGWLDPEVDDHDGDGLSSYDEVMAYGTDPHRRDTDRDGLSDSDERLIGTDTFARDSDGDGLDDGWEAAHGLDPLDPADALHDYDCDGLSTVYEVNVLKTDPFLLDTDGDGLDDGLESDKQFALLVGGYPENMSLTWAEPYAGAGMTPALAVGATEWDRTVLFKGGTAVQWRYDEGSYVAMEGVSSFSCGPYQTLFIDSNGGALGQFYDPPKNSPFQYYEGSFGASPRQVAVGGTFAIALLPGGVVTNIGAFADVSGYTRLAAPSPTSTPTLTSIIPHAYAGNFVSFAAPAATPAEPVSPIQIAAGKYASLALGPDGTVKMWGRPYQNILSVPPDLSNVVKVAAGTYHSAALMRDGTVRMWGFNLYGQLNIPEGLSNIADIACSDYATIAARADGSLAAWGDLNMHPQVKEVPASVSNVASVFACGKAGWALTTDGAVVGWDYSLSFAPLPWKVVSAAFANRSVYVGCRGVALVRLGTDPLTADSDGDGLSDGWEFAQAFDPRVPADRADSDANGMPDVWETLQFGSAGQDPDADPDGDGIPNQAECLMGSDPLFSLQVITAAHGWHALAWNAFPSASSYVVTFSSCGQTVTTLVTTATSVTLNGRLPAAACSATVTARSASGLTLRTGAESWEQPAAGSGITAWKIAGAFAFNRQDGCPYTNVLTRTLTVNRTAEWDEFFVSSSSAGAGGWSLFGASLAWSDGASGTTLSASPPEDSLRLAGVAPEAKKLGIRLGMPCGKGVTRCPSALYLLRWSPTVAWVTPADTNSAAYVIVTEHRATLASGGLPLSLPSITVSMAGYPHRAESPQPRTFPPPAEHSSAAVTSATFTVTGSGVMQGPVIRPGEPGAVTWVFGSAGVPLPAPVGILPRQSVSVAPLSSGGDEVGSGSGLSLAIQCVGHTIQRYWYGQDSADAHRGKCCYFPYNSFCGWDNLCGSGYGDDVSDHLSTHYSIQVSGSGEVESASPFQEDGSENDSPLIAFNGANATPYTLAWKNEIILNGEASPERSYSGSEDCTNTVESVSSDCGCTDGGCGNEGPALGSARFLLKLGASGARASDGALYFNTPTPEVARANLLLLNDGTAIVERDAGGITRVATSLRNITVTDISCGFRITVRSSLPGENRIWEITNPDRADLSRALFVKNPGVTEERFELASGQDDWWQLSEIGDNGVTRHMRAKRTLAGPPETVEELVLEPGGVDPGSPFAGLCRLSHVRTSYVDINGYRRKFREEMWNGYSASFETNTFVYVDAPGNPLRNGKPQLTVRADGSWEHLVYDSFGRVTARSVPEHGGVLPPGNPAAFSPLSCTGLLVAVSAYPEQYKAALVPEQPREFAEYAVTGDGLILVSRVWNDYVEVVSTVGGLGGVSCLQKVTVRAHAPSALKDDPANLVSVSVSCGPHREDWRRGLSVFRRAEDGLETHDRYEEGTYDAGTGAFTPAVGGGFVRAVSATLPHPSVTVPNNVITAEIKVTDAQWGSTLLSETRLLPGGDLSGDASSWPLLSWSRYMYEGNRLVRTLYSDGTSESQVWDCCRITSSTARDGTVRQSDTLSVDGWSLASDVFLSALPGAGGRYPATEIWTDALGRETNSVRAVWFNGSRDSAYAPLATRTGYPFGTDHYRVSVDLLGVETVSRRYCGRGGEVEETASAGVTSRVIRLQGGAAVSEKSWCDPVTGTPVWTRETRETSLRRDGCRAETVRSEASDRLGSVVTSETLYDFLGRVHVTATPLSVSTNVYSKGRLVRVSRSGSPETLYVYDALGNVIENVIDADGDGSVNYAGIDHITRTGTGYERLGEDWYRVTSSRVWNAAGHDTSLQVSASRVRMTGLGGAAPAHISPNAILTAQSEMIDWQGNRTVSYTYTDAASASAWQVADTPESDQDAVQATVAGYPVSDISATGVFASYTYDGFSRQTLAETFSCSGDRRVALSTHYNALGQIEYAEDAAANRTSYAYDAVGRRVAVTDALAHATHTAYDAVGRAVATWGATCPVAYEYDTQGRMVAMATTRNPDFASTNLLHLLAPGGRLSVSSVPSVDVTKWLYDSVTGLLTNKVYADGTGPSFTYTSSGRLASRVWARGVATSYAYDAFGQLVSVDYSDATPDVTYTYDRVGRNIEARTALSASGLAISSVSNAYSGLNLVSETQNGMQIIRDYDSLGRPWDLYTHDLEYECGYVYDGVGRLLDVVSYTDAEFHVYHYGYAPGADLVLSVTGSKGFIYEPSLSATLSRNVSYEPNRDVITAVSNLWNGLPVSDYGYINDSLGRRVTRTDAQSGVGVTPMVITNGFCYDTRSEVTNAIMGTHAYGYVYDSIGNRIVATADGSGTEYLSNPLNQYTNLQSTAYSLQPSYDADGNMIVSGDWHLLWDAENRLVMASNATAVVRNVYDHQSRRIRKEVYSVDAGTAAYSLQSTASFLYDGWNVISEKITNSRTNERTNFFVWGLDLSGTLQGAGGVGGLLAVIADSPNQSNGLNTYLPAYDANGNVTAYLDVTGVVVAQREYDAFGNTVSCSGSMAEDFAYWFSTKYLDAETGMYGFVFRFYHPDLGRWVNRDLIEEDGGLNLFGFLENDPLNVYDNLGLFGAGKQYAKVHGLIAVTVLGKSLDQFVQKPVPFGHSDFAGGNRFDFVKEDVDPLTGPWNLFSAGNHFLDLEEARKDAKAAADKCVCDKNKFERAAHRVQDYFSHYRERYRVRPFLVWKNLGFGHLFAGFSDDDPDDNFPAWKDADRETIGLVKMWDDNKCGRKQP